MNSDWQDADGFWHDKKCVNGLPRSNNRWIYTAYRYIMHGFSRSTDIGKAFNDSLAKNDLVFYVYRLPNDPTPPMSRDEALGMGILGADIYCLLKENNWYLCRKEVVEGYSWARCIASLIYVYFETFNLKGSTKRNYIWENKILPAYKLAFKLLPHDVYFFKKYNGYAPTIFETIMFQLYSFSTLIQKDYSARNVHWAQCEAIQASFWLRFINRKENFKRYFEPEHPFNGKNILENLNEYDYNI